MEENEEEEKSRRNQTLGEEEKNTLPPSINQSINGYVHNSVATPPGFYAPILGHEKKGLPNNRSGWAVEKEKKFIK